MMVQIHAMCPEQEDEPLLAMFPAGGRLVAVPGIFDHRLVLQVVVDDDWRPTEENVICSPVQVVVGPNPPPPPSGWVAYGEFGVSLSSFDAQELPARLWLPAELVESVQGEVLVLAQATGPEPQMTWYERRWDRPSLN